MNEYTVELGGQKFTQAQWEAVQTFMKPPPADAEADAAYAAYLTGRDVPIEEDGYEIPEGMMLVSEAEWDRLRVEADDYHRSENPKACKCCGKQTVPVTADLCFECHSFRKQ
jgi:hypothetical protein